MEEPSTEASRPTKMLVQLSTPGSTFRDEKRGEVERNTMREAAGSARRRILPLPVKRALNI
jgi:hypothetical protein